MFCREHVAQLRQRRARLDAAGARIVVVAAGDPPSRASFRATTGFHGTVLVDEERRLARALGVPRGRWRVLGPRVWLDFLRGARRGFRSERSGSDVFEMGADLVVAPAGVAYRRVGRFASDRPPADQLVEAAERASRTPG